MLSCHHDDHYTEFKCLSGPITLILSECALQGVGKRTLLLRSHLVSLYVQFLGAPDAQSAGVAPGCVLLGLFTCFVIESISSEHRLSCGVCTLRFKRTRTSLVIGADDNKTRFTRGLKEVNTQKLRLLVDLLVSTGLGRANQSTSGTVSGASQQ